MIKNLLLTKRKRDPGVQFNNANAIPSVDTPYIILFQPIHGQNQRDCMKEQESDHKDHANERMLEKTESAIPL